MAVTTVDTIDIIVKNSSILFYVSISVVYMRYVSIEAFHYD